MNSRAFKVRNCKGCGVPITVRFSTQNRCRDCAYKSYKPIRQRGKQATRWETFRDEEARPYLDRTYGHICSRDGCHVTVNLDVDHIKKRGSHPELRYELTNLRYLCRQHHIEETDKLHWSSSSGS